MACDCLEKTEKRILEKVFEMHPDRNIEESGFEHKVWAFDDGLTLLCHNFKYDYTFTKKNGDQSRTMKGEISINPTYCGFCGKKFIEDKPDGE